MTAPSQVALHVTLVCRGSVADGLGHVFRSAAVAHALRAAGAQTHLIAIGDDSARAVLSDDDGRVDVIEESALATTVGGTDAVVFDLLDLDEPVFTALAQGRPTVSLSPVFTHQARVDASFSRTRHEPDADLAADPTRHRRDPRFTVVRPGVRAVDHTDYVSHLYDELLNVGVAMGGTDAANRTLRVLETLRKSPTGLLFWVMLGEGYGHSYEELVEAVRAEGRHEIVLAKTTRSMWTVLGRCKLLLLAGGTTSYEAAFVGVPAVNLLRDDSQRYLVDELADAGAAVTVIEDEGWEDELRGHLDDLHADRDRLFLMHRRSRGLIDGDGAARIAGEIVALIASGPGQGSNG